MNPLLLMILALLVGQFDWRPTNKPGHAALFKDGVQVGALEIATGVYHELRGGRWYQTACPVSYPEPNRPEDKKAPPVPPEKAQETKKEPKEPMENFGLNLDGPWSDHECFRFNGEPVDKSRAVAALVGDQAGGKVDPDQFTDDSQHYRLTIIGSEAQRKNAVDALKADPRWREIEGEVLVKSYAPDNWAVRGKGFKTVDGRASFTLTDRAGKLIFEGEDAGGVFDALRRKKSPSWDIDWRGWSLGINPWTWAPTLGFSFLHIPGELVALLVAGLVAIFWFRSHPQQPNPPPKV